MNKIVLVSIFVCWTVNTYCQTPEDLLQTVRKKIERVNSYEAKGTLRTNLLFIKAPIVTVRLYFKQPNLLKIVNEKGFSFIPKSMDNLNLNKFFTTVEAYEILDGGNEAGTNFRILKLLPLDENTDWVLSVLYIDEENKVIRKIRNTTRESGTFELQLSYGKFIDYSLPDKISFLFNTKTYKLPKGMTLDYTIGNEKAIKTGDSKKGVIEMMFSSYKINKGVPEEIFSNQ